MRKSWCTSNEIKAHVRYRLAASGHHLQVVKLVRNTQTYSVQKPSDLWTAKGYSLTTEVLRVLR
jgi:hypothetical protein